jgi:hypothetical protein
VLTVAEEGIVAITLFGEPALTVPLDRFLTRR